ncbi:Type I phosphodiesterase/nucleotide pyrophosphatase [Acidobacteriia bacterium SbA2]|nr:Type I phosphodiesterase/nucleotide pyrophosphatase [Acidobacteriia bacterium SbA2]
MKNLSQRTWHAKDPLTRPTPAEENAGSVHPLPQGGEGSNTRWQGTNRWVVRAIFISFVILLFTPTVLHAYVGPGAGFAFLSSFLTLFLAFVYSLFAFITWPVRRLFRLLRGRRAYRHAQVKRVAIVGFDGMDPNLAERFMQEGKLPNFARLRDQGTFRRLATTCPPDSPVAWSTFMTGVNPGKHNIYDFMGRDLGTYLPYLSSVQIRDAKKSLKIGKYTIPLGKPRVKLLRKGIPFWHFLGKAGVFCSVLRVPITFPPEKFEGVLLSGMCVPDLQGSQGTFSFYSSGGVASGDKPEGGARFLFERDGQRFRSSIPGPENPLRRQPGTPLRLEFSIKPLASNETAEIQIDGRRFELRKGEYSEWIELKFKAGLGIKVHGVCRFFLKALTPNVELYVSPVNIDPGHPALPISHPLIYSVYLAKLLGPYATLGLAEDTWALSEGVLDDEAFLKQCYLIHDERERMFFDALEKTPRGLCACVFDATDRIQHMFWRYLDPNHPAVNSETDRRRFGGVIEDLYRRADDLVGRILERLGDDGVLIVVSDHGFNSFARGMNVNSWLWRNGYLALKDGVGRSGEWFENVDWEHTRAYALGLNGLYINQRGRESGGIVAPGEETRSLKRELQEKLQALTDPSTGSAPIAHVRDRDAVYTGPFRENAPDLIVGYAKGYRVGWDSAKGKVSEAVLEDNCKAWSGDHCIDPLLVPGVLFSNRKLGCEDPAIADVAPSMLSWFGLSAPPQMDGKAWKLP